MKLINELAEELHQKIEDPNLVIQFCDYDDYSRDYVAINDRFMNEVARIPLKACYLSQCNLNLPKLNLKNADLLAIDSFIKKILGTASSKLLSEPKYVVMPENLNSSHGPQLLSTDDKDRIFFAAKINGLKQTFTHDELQELIYRHADGAETSWLTPVINQYKKLVN